MGKKKRSNPLAAERRARYTGDPEYRRERPADIAAMIDHAQADALEQEHPDYQEEWEKLSPEDKLILQSQMRRAGATTRGLLEHYGL